MIGAAARVVDPLDQEFDDARHAANDNVDTQVHADQIGGLRPHHHQETR